MLKKIISVYDIKANVFGEPKLFFTIEEAIRAFGHSANEPNNPFFTHGEDYVLYELGTYNEENGIILPCVTPVSVMAATNASKVHREFYAARAAKAAAADDLATLQ